MIALISGLNWACAHRRGIPPCMPVEYTPSNTTPEPKMGPSESFGHTRGYGPTEAVNEANSPSAFLDSQEKKHFLTRKRAHLSPRNVAGALCFPDINEVFPIQTLHPSDFSQFSDELPVLFWTEPIAMLSVFVYYNHRITYLYGLSQVIISTNGRNQDAGNPVC